MNATFRTATVNDLDALLPLFRAYQEHYRTLTDATETETREFLRRLVSTPNEGFVVLAEREARIAGFATGYITVSGVIAKRLVHLGDLFVVPEHRRQGTATALISEVVRRARDAGIPLVRWLSVATNTELNAWYASLGATTGDFRLFLLPTAGPGAPG